MSEETKLSQLQLEMLERIKTTLLNMGCVFVIQLPDRTLTGHTEAFQLVQPKTSKRGPPVFPRGEVKSYVAKQIADMKSGEVRYVPCDKYGCHRVQSAMCSFATEYWGEGNYITARRADDTIEILRTDGV